MYLKFLRQNHTENLKLVFLGYGQDENPFSYLTECTKDDVAIIFDYENSDIEAASLLEYQSLSVVAWSMGVMIAPMVLSRLNLNNKVKSAVAINGTLEGIDDNRGIPHKLWDATINGMSERNAKKFLRRMCNDADAFDEYMKNAPARSVESLRAELEHIKSMAREDKQNFKYDHAYLSLNDKIFIFENMKNSFDEHSISYDSFDDGHYSKNILMKALSHD
ncbi:MAG: pimeloyl-ACP methyl esterase BioG family protein [Succinivibrio sp.]